MTRKLLYVIPTLIFALGILLISVLRTAAVRIEVPKTTGQEIGKHVLGEDDPHIEYALPYPGNILPDSPFWPLKALRDRVWYTVTTKPTREAELLLLFADKRVGSAKLLVDQGNYEAGVTTLAKAEKYLEDAKDKERNLRQEGYDTSQLLNQLAYSSLKHYELMLDIYDKVPESMRPAVADNYSYAVASYESVRDAMLQEKLTPPENPFDW